MSNLPAIRVQDAALERRRMAGDARLARVLTRHEMRMFRASCGKRIKDIEDGELLKRLGNLFRVVAMDTGYTIPAAGEWALIQTRLFEYIREYYGGYTIEDVSLAFELLVVGELDNYLPRDSQGNADRKHYQRFNADYFARVLNAYGRRQNTVLEKSYKAVEVQEDTQPTKEEIDRYMRYLYKVVEKVYLRYKYTGVLTFGVGDEMLCYMFLSGVGLAEDVEVSDSDRALALRRYMSRALSGLVNKYVAERVRKEGDKSSELDFTSYEIARGRAIEEAFKYMVDNEIQLKDFIR